MGYVVVSGDHGTTARMETAAWIGIGSNMDGPERQVEMAIDTLGSIVGTRLIRRSSLYRSAPLGPLNQPDYVNAVAEIATVLKPHGLLDELLALEAEAGRIRGGERWGARVLDLDILLYGDAVISDERLCVPHPGLPLRSFVLYPLYEMEPGLHVAGFGSIADLVSSCPPGDLARMESK